MGVGALFDALLRLNSLNSKAENGVGNLSILNISNKVVVGILGLDVGHLVVPPHHSLPIRLVILQEHSVVIWVFSESAHDVIFWSHLTLLDTLEGEAFQGLSNVKDCSLLSSLILKVDSSSLGILILWQQMDTTFGELEKKNTDMELFVNQMLELWLVHLDQLDTKWMDLNIHIDSLCHN